MIRSLLKSLFGLIRRLAAAVLIAALLILDCGCIKDKDPIKPDPVYYQCEKMYLACQIGSPHLRYRWFPVCADTVFIDSVTIVKYGKGPEADPTKWHWVRVYADTVYIDSSTIIIRGARNDTGVN